MSQSLASGVYNGARLCPGNGRKDHLSETMANLRQGDGGKRSLGGIYVQDTVPGFHCAGDMPAGREPRSQAQDSGGTLASSSRAGIHASHTCGLSAACRG